MHVLDLLNKKKYIALYTQLGYLKFVGLSGPVNIQGYPMDGIYVKENTTCWKKWLLGKKRFVSALLFIFRILFLLLLLLFCFWCFFFLVFNNNNKNHKEFGEKRKKKVRKWPKVIIRKKYQASVQTSVYFNFISVWMVSTR